MIIAISGMPGSGKSTLAKMVAEKLKLQYYSIGSLMREIATKNNLSLLEMSAYAEKDKRVDAMLDNAQADLAIKEDNYVLDSRLGYHFLKKAFKVFITVSDEEAAKRVFEAKRAEEKENTSVEETQKSLKKRHESEVFRYKKHYGLNPFDESNYDYILDTTGLTAEQAASKLIERVLVWNTDKSASAKNAYPSNFKKRFE
jgi:CMP/dCMP kinase